MATRQRLTDNELDAYAHHASAQRDEPLASLVAEVQARRRTSAADNRPRWAVVVLDAGQLGLLAPVLAAADDAGSVLVVAPEGTRLPAINNNARGWSLETYDPADPFDLRRVLQTYGIGG